MQAGAPPDARTPTGWPYLLLKACPGASNPAARIALASDMSVDMVAEICTSSESSVCRARCSVVPYSRRATRSTSPGRRSGGSCSKARRQGWRRCEVVASSRWGALLFAGAGAQLTHTYMLATQAPSHSLTPRRAPRTGRRTDSTTCGNTAPSTHAGPAPPTM
jgi:hypothetical protein